MAMSYEGPRSTGGSFGGQQQQQQQLSTNASQGGGNNSNLATNATVTMMVRSCNVCTRVSREEGKGAWKGWGDGGVRGSGGGGSG